MSLNLSLEACLKDLRKKWSSIEYENLAIKFYFGSPLASFLGLHLDGLLAGIVYQDMLQKTNIYHHIDFDDDMIDIPIPVEKIRIDDDFVYKASLLKNTKEIVYKKTTLKKRFNTARLLLLKEIKNIRVDCGIYKNTDMPIVYDANVSPMIAYCRGNKFEIEKILRTPFSIGKHREKGFGYVNKIEIAIQEEDFSVIRNGKLQRCMPQSFVERIKQKLNINTQELITGYYNHKPPYFQGVSNILCFQPR